MQFELMKTLKYRGICNTCLNKGRSLVNDDDENATYEYITTLVKVQIKGNTCFFLVTTLERCCRHFVSVACYIRIAPYHESRSVA